MGTFLWIFLVGGCLFMFFGWLFLGRDSKEYKEYQKNKNNISYCRKKKLDKIDKL